MNNYYVYAYIHPETKKYFYIGKGKDQRAYLHWNKPQYIKNNFFKKEILRLKIKNKCPKIVFLKKKLKCGQAYKLEHELILKYGRLKIDKNGILFNRSIGFEHFNIENDKIEKYLKNIDESVKHFNYKELDTKTINDICYLYSVKEKSIHQIRKKYGFGPGKIRNVLTSNGIRIRTKSETRLGNKNPAWGRRGLITKGFTGKKHTKESKLKISKASKLMHKIKKK